MSQELLYLSRSDVEAVALSMGRVIELLEKAFFEKGMGRVEMPPKPGVHPRPDAFIHAMPAYIPAMEAVGVQWVSGYPGNRKRGLPYISGPLVLNDPATGLPPCVMDATWVTAKRTGAASALAAKYLARKDSEVMGVLGCGVQGRSHLEAMRELFPIRKVYAYDTDPKASERYASEMEGRFGLEVVTVGSPREAAADADKVEPAGPILQDPKPTIGQDWLKPGGFACPVDFDSYWKPEALAQIDKYATDDIPQYRYYRSVGYFKNAPEPYADLGEIVTGKKPGREHDDERTMAMNLGLALDDMAVAPEIYRRAKEMGIRTYLPL